MRSNGIALIHSYDWPASSVIPWVLIEVAMPRMPCCDNQPDKSQTRDRAL